MELPILNSEIKNYNLRIVPPHPIFNEITGFKRQFEAAFGKQQFSKSKPHITLAAFKMHIQYQDMLLKAFNQLSDIGKFKLDIQGFGVFENNLNVHLKVSRTKEMDQIHTQLKILWVRNLYRKQASLTISKTPHITISNTDGKKSLHEGLALFREIDYSRQFLVNRLTLVSRYESKTWDWEHQISLSPNDPVQFFVKP